jgi:GNAT superfamily N-acetyltransferase
MNQEQPLSAPSPASRLEVSCRPEQPGDEAFLFTLYSSTRQEELQAFGWDDTLRNSFLRMQFEAMRQGYRSMFPQAAFSIILAGGEPAGRTVINRTQQEIRLVDISLLHQYRGRGIGTGILSDLLAEALQTGLPLRLSAMKASRALDWYLRRGFHQVGESGPYVHLESAPHQAGQDSKPSPTTG